MDRHNTSQQDKVGKLQLAMVRVQQHADSKVSQVSNPLPGAACPELPHTQHFTGFS